MNYEPYEYQTHSVEHILNNNNCGLFLDMGLGKTVVSLTAIDTLMFSDLEVNKCLVIAPKRVANVVWPEEVAKWDHLKHLRLSVITGDEMQRIKALKAKADIYVINRENVSWLVRYYQSAWPYDMVIIDELSSFKSSKAVRFKSLKMVRGKIKRLVGLTGTPAPNSLIDLWPQLYLLDEGARLGKLIGGYRERYFTRNYNGFGYKVREGSDKKIYSLIEDICISMKSADYIELPSKVEKDIVIELPDMKKYLAFERDCVLQLVDKEITAVNAAALTTKLLQYASGAIYDSEAKTHFVHDEKLNALEEVIESANGKPMLVFYNYKHSAVRIIERFKARKLETEADIRAWNEGKVPLLIAHPASAGHGLNLQYGGNLVTWYDLNWSLELYLQGNTRVYRQGQLKPVVINRLIVKGTMDEDVAACLHRKTNGQEALLEAIKARVKKWDR